MTARKKKGYKHLPKLPKIPPQKPWDESEDLVNLEDYKNAMRELVKWEARNRELDRDRFATLQCLIGYEHLLKEGILENGDMKESQYEAFREISKRKARWLIMNGLYFAQLREEASAEADDDEGMEE